MAPTLRLSQVTCKGLCGHRKYLSGDEQLEMMWSSCCQPWLLYNTLWEHCHHLPLGSSYLPEASSLLWPPPLAWLYSMGLLSKQTVFIFLMTLPYMVRKRFHWLAQPSSWKPSSFWLDVFQPSVSPNRDLGRICGYFCLSALTGGLEKNKFLSWTFILTLKKSQS